MSAPTADFVALNGPRPQNRAALAELIVNEASVSSTILLLTAHSFSARSWRAELARRAPALSGFIRVTTPLGFAHALIGEHGHRVIDPPELRQFVAGLLRSEAQSDRAEKLWPTQQPFLLGSAFLDEILRELGERIHGGSDSPDDRAAELRDFVSRFEAGLAEQVFFDHPRALHEACHLLGTMTPVAYDFDPTGRLVVDRSEAFTGGAALLLGAVVERAEQRRVAIAMSTTSRPDRRLDEDLRCSVLRVHHPAVQADAIVSLLRKWLDAGLDPSRVAVVMPRRDLVLESSLAAAARRFDVPLVLAAARIGDQQVVRDCAQSILDNPAGSCEEPGDAAYSWWQHNAGALLNDQRSVDVIGAFIHALRSGDSVDAALDRPAPSPVDRGIAVLSLNGAIDRPSDEPWQGVIVTGCVDGLFPRRAVARRWFRRATSHGDGSTDLSTGCDELADRDRLRLEELLRSVDADGSIVGISAPLAGQLSSPFVDGWQRAELSLLRPESAMPPRPTDDTETDIALFASGSLRLSATQLTTFEDCSLRYGFEYGLGLRSAGGASATAGSLVHRALETFLSPEATDHSSERLMEVLEELWDHGEFPFAAQGLDYRRRAEQWLANWWEFYRDTTPDVQRTEYRFDVPFPPGDPSSDDGIEHRRHHTIVGSIDRVDAIEPMIPGSPAGVRIVDYKTGAPKSPAEIANDLQLAIYHYAATHDPVLRGIGPPHRLELHYLQDDASKERVRVMGRVVTDDLESETVARINGLVSEVLSEDYSPNPDANCDYCSFHSLCPTKLQGRQVR